MPDINEQLFVESTKDLTHHLEIEDNSRIIFSGAYGTGKTTFLNHYFDKLSDKYAVIRLAPVNYSVASNEDIFRYIKYDILCQLVINSRLTFTNYDLKPVDRWAVIFLTQQKQLIRAITKGIGKIKLEATGLSKIYDELEELYKQIEAYKSPEEISSGFLESIAVEEGSLFEFNIISEFISNTLKDTKDKQNVLIIDDLDRIDPEHIFRLLNVFAAHIDFDSTGKNKFGFEKIILVCDINNIRNIFAAKYGVSTDFNGYIDKFYSSKIFYFDNRIDLGRILDFLLKKIGAFRGRDRLLTENVQMIRNELYHILSTFISKGFCNLRSIMKHENYYLNNGTIMFPGGLSVQKYELISPAVIDILLQMFGDKERLLNLLERSIDHRETYSQIENNNLRHILMLVKMPIHNARLGTFTIDELGVSAEFLINATAERVPFANLSKLARTSGQSPTDDYREKLNLFRLYIEAISILDRSAALN